jgi:hypothetical protein
VDEPIGRRVRPDSSETTTDAKGSFELSNLAEGNYDLKATMTGWLGGDAGRSRWADPARWFSVSKNQVLDGLELKLWRASTISGRVVDESGHGVSGADVGLGLMTALGGHADLLPFWMASTDSDGRFSANEARAGHVGGSITPGEYAILATGPATGVPPTVDGQPRAWGLGYYPAQSGALPARTISVAAGKDLSDIVLSLPSVPVFRVTGRAIDLPAFSRAPSAIDVIGQLRSVDHDWRDQFFFKPFAEQIEPERLSVAGVPPGRYRFSALRFPPYSQESFLRFAAPDKDPTWWAEAAVEVIDRDVEAPLVFRQGVRVRGQLRLQGRARPPADFSAKTELTIQSLEDGADYQSTILPTGKFVTMQVPPGRYLVRATPPQGWWFDSMSTTQRRREDDAIEPGSSDIDGIDVLLTDRPPATLNGIVRGAAAAHVHATVVIFPADQSMWVAFGRNPRRIRTAETGTSARFSVVLPPGRYYAIALTSQSDLLETSEGFAALAPRATIVTLTEHGVANVELHFIAVH